MKANTISEREMNTQKSELEDKLIEEDDDEEV
jgi:hypothetical protein